MPEEFDPNIQPQPGAEASPPLADLSPYLAEIPLDAQPENPPAPQIPQENLAPAIDLDGIPLAALAGTSQSSVLIPAQPVGQPLETFDIKPIEKPLNPPKLDPPPHLPGISFPDDFRRSPAPPSYTWMPQYSRKRIWNRPAVKRAVPLFVSAVMHLIIIAGALAILPPLVQKAFKKSEQEQVVIPDTTLAITGDIGGLPNPGLGKDPSRQLSQEQDPTANDGKAWTQSKSQSLSQALQSAAGDSYDLAQGQNSQTGHGNDNSAIGAFNEDSGGPAASFGPRGTGGTAGPRSKLFGTGSNVRSVIYICDGSGSLEESAKAEVLKNELKLDIARLDPVQAFNVLIFQDHDNAKFITLSPKLMMASPINKSRVFDFIDHHLEFHGTTNPVPALGEAFIEKPELMYLLTDGDFDNPSGQEVLDKVDQLNRDKKVRLNTVLLLGTHAEKDAYTQFEGIMARISGDNGGDRLKKLYAEDFLKE